MEKLSAGAYAELIRNCQVLQKDSYGEKVLLSDDGQVIKIFRRKRLLSSALLFPYACRFADNAKQLQQRDIPTINVIKLSRCRPLKRDLVWYDLMEGETLRDYCQCGDPQEIITSFGRFVAQLHQRGVLFRSLHWANVIVQPDKTLGLIDIADLRLFKRPLTVKQRLRNFCHILRYRSDHHLFDQHRDCFWRGYAEVDELSFSHSQLLQQKIPLINERR